MLAERFSNFVLNQKAKLEMKNSSEEPREKNECDHPIDRTNGKLVDRRI